MPRYSKSEFKDLCFITHATLSMAVKRNKVIPNTNSEIDTSLQINQDFLEKYIEKQRIKVLKLSSDYKEPEPEPEVNIMPRYKNPPPPPKPKTIRTPKAPLQKQKAPKVTKREISKEDEVIEKKAIARHDLDTIKKELEIEEKETSIAINKIKLDKLNGVVIPTELVMILFGQHSKSITTAFHQAAEKYIVLMGKNYGADKKAQARMRGDLIVVVNKAIEDSLEISRNGIKNIVDEYALNGK
jgi:hypothetical protein